MIYLKSFGERLVEAREKQNLTQKALAEMLGITPTRLNYWEKDKREPNITMIKQIASALNVPVSELLGIDEKRLAESVQILEATITYCKKLGYAIAEQPTKWHWEDENETDPSKQVQIVDEVEYTLFKDGHTATFTQAEFEELQAKAKEAIEGRFYKKVLEQQNSQEKK